MSGVSVVVTVLNEANNVGLLLDDLLAQDEPADEILVVDGGSTDGTQAIVESKGAPVRLLRAPGANISQGRNRGIAEARNELVAVTDAGVRLGPDWLRHISRPLRDGRAEVVAGFFEPDPQSAFETALGATVLPAVEDIRPETFLPSSRSIAFRKHVWNDVGGYPEWLDYCEDLIFDLNFRRLPEVRVVFEPRATVRFRPRSSLRAFFRQYFRYARGDGKADLWRKRHALRYGAYLHLLATLACLFSPRARRHKAALAYFTVSSALGSAAYLWKPLRRLLPLTAGSSASERACMLALLPLIRLTGDMAKMAGYPAGCAWRLRKSYADGESRETSTAARSVPAQAATR
ncbi:MAG TPA: glycosyltransferase [Chloroflexota bacterium]|nr:glycosyltransferase [Chloroflexota bacterium]